MKRIYAGLFLVSLTTLMMELALTRVFDVILTPNLGYMVITLALFSFGVAGVYATIKPAANATLERLLFGIALASVFFGAAILALRPAFNTLPFDYEKIGSQPVVQIFSFLGMYSILILPFFFSGLIFVRVFSTYPESIQVLYFWDLFGAAVGCVILIPLLPHIRPGGILLCGCAFTLIASGLFAKNVKFSLGTWAAAAVLLSSPFVHKGYYDFNEHVNKRWVKMDRLAGKVEKTYWDPISKIDVIDKGTYKHIAYDGGYQSSFSYPFDGNLAGLREEMPEHVLENFWERSVLACHYLKRDSGQRVLVIGSAGGQETKAALMYGASHVDAVEMVGYVVRIGKEDYARYNGNIFNDARVRVYVGEGRSFLRSNGSKYDIIQIYSNHTSSSIAAGTGAMVTNYLQTVEAYEE